MAGEGDGGTGSCPRKLTEQMQTASIWVFTAQFFRIFFMLKMFIIKCWRRKKNKESLAVPLSARHHSSRVFQAMVATPSASYGAQT